MSAIDPIPPDFDGCARSCRKTGVHTKVWGDCAFGVEPEPSVMLGHRYIAEDGYGAIGLGSVPVSELATRIERALRSVSITLGPNARGQLDRGEPVRLSGGEYSAMALAVAMDLAEGSQS